MKRTLLFVASVTTAAFLLNLVLRPRYRRWGVQPVELSRTLPGDDLVPAPDYRADLAVTIDAGPGDIWPWLAQMGYRRGGLYSYDWLDRVFGILDAPSADVILPQWQDLRAGDEIPLGRGPTFPVVEAEPDHHLLLGDTTGGMWSWLLYLDPLPDGRTRLISRNLARFPGFVGGAMLRLWLEPAAFIMTRRMLLNLKDRAEALALERGASANVAQPASTIPGP